VGAHARGTAAGWCVCKCVCVGRNTGGEHGPATALTANCCTPHTSSSPHSGVVTVRSHMPSMKRWNISGPASLLELAPAARVTAVATSREAKAVRIWIVALGIVLHQSRDGRQAPNNRPACVCPGSTVCLHICRLGRHKSCSWLGSHRDQRLGAGSRRPAHGAPQCSWRRGAAGGCSGKV
jgi:hypothetical protein